MDTETLLCEIKKGAKSWNSFRKLFPAGQLSLDGIELRNMQLDDYDFSKMSFRNSKISGCSFKGADFISSNFEYSCLTNNDFTNAKLIATQLSDSDLSGSILCNANLLTAVTRGAKLENIDFRGRDISGLILRGVSLAGSNLEGQQLARVDFSGSNLQGVNFNKADLSYSIFSGSNLIGVTFDGAQLVGAIFKNANLTACNLAGQNLSQADFSETDLTDVDLREANLNKAKFIGANLTGSKLWKISTQGWVLTNVICKFAYWDKSGKEKTHYRPHEFERIFAELITIELRYPYRLVDHELATLPIFIEHLTAVHWGIILRLRSIVDIAGGALVQFVVEEVGTHNPTDLKEQLQMEAERIQLAQLVLRSNTELHLQLKEKIGAIREEFWPRLLELAADHETGKVRNLTILFMDLKGFSKWKHDELSEKLSLFRGLLKPILKKWNAGHPNMEGDSLRVTFKNATAGLSCACMLRNVLIAAGFELRIGVDLGEVNLVYNEVTDNPDLEGVAVNMAARLEAAADSGDVLVSHKVHHYAERSGLFKFTAKQVSLKKDIGHMHQGESIDCFAVEML
jgi:uncharacterized protein YjbI with pentapeptide repeats/class 3 adenylate cyclase